MFRQKMDSNDYGICDSCSHFRVIKFKATGKFKKDCTEINIEDTPPIESCKKYFNSKWVKLDSMKEIAWEINKNPKNKIGFTAPSQIETKNLSDPLYNYL